MKKESFKKRFCAVYLFAGTLLILMSASVSSFAGVNPLVMQAYQLRMNGKADKAEEMLRTYLAKDTTDALAYFELSRTRQQLLGGLDRMFTENELKEVMDLSAKAVRLDPKNEVFAFYYAICSLLDGFVSMMTGQDAKDKVTRTCGLFQNVLEINPGCYPAKLYLMDLYGLLPPEMGGDREKAMAITDGMKSQDKTCYAMAQVRLMPDTANPVDFWKTAAAQIGMNNRVQEELGRAYLLRQDSENGEKNYLEVIKADPSKIYLTMNLARYYAMMAQQNPANRDNCLTKADEMVNTYLQSVPEPVLTLKAHAYQIQAMISSFRGDQAAVAKYSELATTTDPYCSRASGMPPDILYFPPDNIKINYISFFMPF
jgi:tetratricopeptide (TPR) repeat protein